MRAGKLRHRVTIQEPLLSQNSYGEQVLGGWRDVQKAWAEIFQPTGREYFAIDGKQASKETRVRIRWVDGLDPTYRIKHGRRYFLIKAVVNKNERDRQADLICIEEAETTALAPDEG